VYVFWMAIYLLALLIWNFLLPLCALIRMDEFSWGDTRKVVGDGEKGHAHGEIMDVVRESLVSTVPLKRWEDWQKLCKCGLKRETARVRELMISAPSYYGSTFCPANEDGTLRTNGPPRISLVIPSIPDRYHNGTHRTPVCQFNPRALLPHLHQTTPSILKIKLTTLHPRLSATLRGAQVDPP